MEMPEIVSDASVSVPYAVICNNLSALPRTFVIFQTPGQETQSSAAPLAWNITLVPPSKQMPIVWTFDYSFSWGRATTLLPGRIYKAEQTLDATLTSGNRVTLTRTSGEDYKLIDQTDGMEGTLGVIQDGTIALHQAAIAIGMSGLPAYALEAQPNINVSFRPPSSGADARYYITTVNVIQPGEVIDPGIVATAVEFKFPSNVNKLTATLEPDLTINIS